MSTRFSRWWPWTLLIPLVASGCKGCHLGKEHAPREWACKRIAYHEVLDPEQGAGNAPFSIERLGRELEVMQVQLRPESLRFTSETRMEVDWEFGSKLRVAEATYSPGEELARSTRTDAVYPMKRFVDGNSGRVQFGFRSPVCLKPDERGSYYDCTPTDDEWFLVADMTCEWMLRYDVPMRERRMKLPFKD